LVELLARVDADDTANHLGDNDHVAEVRLDKVGLLVGLGLFFGLSELLDEAHGASLQAAVDSAPGAGVDEFAKLIGGEIEETIISRICVVSQVVYNFSSFSPLFLLLRTL
jgi:hypothetical protein